MDLLNWQSGITLGIALLGAVLGVINTWKALSRDRVCLRVTPGNYANWGGGEIIDGISIEVVNLSMVPITVTQVGFRVSRKRGVIIVADYFRMDALPCRLEPRASMAISVAPGTPEAKELASVKSAYAKTACGLYFHGRSDALKGRIKDAKASLSG